MNILTFSGSLRQQSTNGALLDTLAGMAPDGVSLTRYDYADVPLFNSDLDLPDSVSRLRQAIAAADGVIVATPEYNYSVPGVLKNAIDWASRPAYRSVFHGKPTGVMSAAASIVGGARAQAHLKNVLLGMGTPVFPWPELLVPQAHKLVHDGVIVDERVQKNLRAYLEGFVAWAGQG